MGKKKAGRGGAPDGRAGGRDNEREAARREQAAERHARLVNQRRGSDAFVRRGKLPDGTTVEHLPDFLVQELQRQQERFITKFGREPGPEDPVFFDLDADVPRPVAPEADMEELRHILDEAGIDPAFANAAEELGYIVTEANKYLFSLEEVEAFTAAVKRNQSRRRR